MFVHNVNGGERWSVRKWKFCTYYSNIRPHKKIELVIVLLVAQIRGGRAFF